MATRRTCLRLAAAASSGRRGPETVAPPITPRVWNRNRRRVTSCGMTHPHCSRAQAHISSIRMTFPQEGDLSVLDHLCHSKSHTSIFPSCSKVLYSFEKLRYFVMFTQ